MRKISTALILSVLAIQIASARSHGPLNFKREQAYQMVRNGHKPLTHYRVARQHLMGKIHLRKDKYGYFVEDVYCGLVFRENVGPGKVPPHEKINTEHTWPQSRFNSNISRFMQKSDLHHLYPTDSKTNGVRGNHIFADVRGNFPTGNCYESSIGSTSGEVAFEPPENHKGNVARALFYFAIRYDLNIGEVEEFYLRSWHMNDPVDEAEINRNNEIEKIQGNRNPFIDRPELVYTINNF